MTAIKNEHNRAKTQWVFEPVSVVAGIFLQRLNYALRFSDIADLIATFNVNEIFCFNYWSMIESSASRGKLSMLGIDRIIGHEIPYYL